MPTKTNRTYTVCPHCNTRIKTHKLRRGLHRCTAAHRGKRPKKQVDPCRKP